MKKSSLAKVLLAFVAVFAGCDSADLTKAPVLNRGMYAYFLHSQDDETIIKDIRAFGRNGECRVVLDSPIFFDYVGAISVVSERKDKYEEYLKASGFEIRRDGSDTLVKCRKEDGSTGEIYITSALVLKDGTCVENYHLTVKEYNELEPKISETTWQYFLKKHLPREPLIYNQALDFLLKDCEPKNGKYEITVKTNFGTFDYEIAER